SPTHLLKAFCAFVFVNLPLSESGLLQPDKRAAAKIESARDRIKHMGAPSDERGAAFMSE
ncbi:MAG: hypothetical protein ACREEM_51960, partial [Blastocatellia bacterium]